MNHKGIDMSSPPRLKPKEATQTVVGPDSQPADHARRFTLNYNFLNDDQYERRGCSLDASICDLCCRYIKTAISTQLVSVSNGQWQRFESGYGSFLYMSRYKCSSDLFRSAQNGCAMCIALTQVAQQIEAERMLIIPDYDRIKTGGNVLWSSFLLTDQNKPTYPLSTPGHEFEYDFVLAKNDEDCLQLPIPADKYQGFSLDPLVISRIPPSHPASDQSFAQLRAWYSRCIHKHPRCSRHELPLPSRLLKLKSNGSASVDVMLVESKSLAESTENIAFVALSYCWRGTSHNTTCKANLPERLADGIPFTELPTVIQDAVKVVMKLELQYLWVDAYCICQDDTEEWAIEASRMADVYEGCVFALSALSSHRATTGFLKERNNRPIMLGKIEAYVASRTDAMKLFMRRRPRAVFRELARSPLSQRGWALQERILPTAVLHYGRDQMMWECNTDGLCSETGERKNRFWGRGISLWKDSETCSAAHDFWLRVASDYTRRQLTNSSDKLIAVQGIASRLQREGLLQGRYIAGLWESHLAFGLLWSVTHALELRDLKRDEPELGHWSLPTWSWVRLNAKISWHTVFYPAMVLSKAPRFRPKSTSPDFLDGTGFHAALNCAIELGGFLQRVRDGELCSQTEQSDDDDDDACPEFPNDWSHWEIDEIPLPPGQYYCLRVVDGAFMRETYYLVLRPLIVEDQIAVSDDRLDLYARVGLLKLRLEPEHYQQPYPDVLSPYGRTLLSDGKWVDILLV